MVLDLGERRVELREHPADPTVPLSGELVAVAEPSGGGWMVRWRDGRRDEVADRDAVQDLLTELMQRRR